MTIRPRILLTGANGQVGFEIWQALAPIAEVYAFKGPSDRPAAIPCETLDLADAKAIQTVIAELEPQLIINTAAYTAVDKAESQSEEAFRINADALGTMGQAALRSGAAVLHFSTDYVYPGQGTSPYQESDPTDPMNVYGQSKLQGELKLIGSGATYLIVRTSWVYGVYGQNFVKTMLRLGRERQDLRVVGDQFGAPTSARTLANFTCHLLQRNRSRDMMRSIAAVQGVYHLTDAGCTSWYGFAEEIFRLARLHGMNLQLEQLIACATADYPTAAKRPQNSRLALDKLRAAFDFEPPNWKDSLAAVLAVFASCS